MQQQFSTSELPPSQRSDLFGDKKNQGASYEKFRPKYPQTFVDQILNTVGHKRHYLDVATGTGQLLFKVSPHFDELSVGTDISENQLSVAQKIIE